MTEAPLLLDVNGAIATLTLNRPKSGNTINQPLAQALLDAAIRCDTDPAVRCVVLTGSGKLFCGGGDIGAFAEAGDDVPAFLNRLAGTLHMAITRLMRMSKPLLVLVNGPAAGAGLSLAICGDIVISSSSAHFTAAYGSVGLTPDGGMSWLLPRLIGLRRAQEMIITDRRIAADEAVSIGLVTRVVPETDLARAGADTAQRLAGSATSAIGGARTLLLDSMSRQLEGHLECETRSITAASTTAECREGVSAFLDGRRADFSA